MVSTRHLSDFEIRLLAEAVRRHEPSPSKKPDPRADAAARQAGGDLEQRLVARTRALQNFSDYSEAFERARKLFRIVLIVVAVLVFLAGVAMAKDALPSDALPSNAHRQVNFLSLLLITLGVQVIVLVVWLLVFVASFVPSFVPASGLAEWLASVSRGVLEGFVWLALRAKPSGVQTAQLSATIIDVLFRPPFGRWTVGVITHGLWLLFLIAALGTAWTRLGMKTYSFVWETSTHSEIFLEAVSVPPGALGFAIPDSAAIRESDVSEVRTVNPAVAAAHRDAWVGLLYGSIIVYGLIPRCFLFTFCFFMGRLARRRHRLDTFASGFAELEPRIMPHARKTGYADTDAGVDPMQVPGRSLAYVNRISADPDGPVAVLGLEIERPATGWPPDFDEAGLIDLGCVDSDHDLRDVLDRLKAPASTPRQLIFIASLLTTPDRGLRSRFQQILGGIDVPATLVLTDGGAFRERSVADDVQLRVADWRSMAAEFFPAAQDIVEIDLNHLTAVTRARMTALVGGKELT